MQSCGLASGPEIVLPMPGGRGDSCFERIDMGFWDWGAVRFTYRPSRNLPMLLQWEDRNSMAHSAEARVPYLDHRLVELVVGLPDGMKVANAETKRVLRLAMRGVVPDRVIDRTTKLGFATAEASWMMADRTGAVRQPVREAIERSRGVLRDNATQLCDDVFAGRRRYSGVPWRIVSYGQWLGAFH